MCLKHVKLITFDVTNTLLKFKVPPWNQYGKVAREHGFTGDDNELAKRFVYKYRTMWKEYPNFGKGTHIGWEEWWIHVVKYTLSGQLPENADLDGISTHLINEYKTAKLWQTVEGGVNLLQLIKRKHIIAGVISNFDPRLYEILHNINLIKHFDFIVTSYECGYSKPDKNIFECAIKKCNEHITPDQCLHIGDDVVKDYRGAKNAGWHALLIGDDKRSGPKPQHILSNMQHLLEAVQYNKLVL